MSRCASAARALQIMESHRERAAFFVGSTLAVADIAFHTHTHVAHEGGFGLERIPPLRAGLAGVQAHPGHLATGAR